MDYKELLKRAKSGIPQSKNGSRFEIPVASVNAAKRQTVIKNLSDIAKGIRRDVKHLARFFCRELAVPGTLKGGDLVLQGKVPASIINKRLNEYVKEYVLCKECGKPDTSMKKEQSVIMIKCEACGARKTLKA